MKGGELAYRSREGAPVFCNGMTHGEVLKRGEFGTGAQSHRPYAHKTLENHLVALRRSYEDAGVVAGANPCNHEDVKGTMAALKIILGSARGSLPDIISCEVAQRLLSILDAENLRDVTMAVMVAEGAALGERASTRGLRDFGHCQLSKEGVAIHINYHKSDKEQKGCDTGIMHSSACVPGGLNVVRDERGEQTDSAAPDAARGRGVRGIRARVARSINTYGALSGRPSQCRRRRSRRAKQRLRPR